MSEPTFSYTHEQAVAAAMKWHREIYGAPKDAADKDVYYARLGQLLDFVMDIFPKNLSRE